MILHCLRDQFWRQRYPLALFSLVAMGVGVQAAAGRSSVWLLAMVGMSTGMTHGVSPIYRQTWMLPVSLRELWLVRWLMSVGIPTVCIPPLMLAGAWGASLFGGSVPAAVESIAVSTLCWFVYLGTFMALVVLHERSGHQGWKTAGLIMQLCAFALLWSGFGAAFYWRDRLPFGWSDLLPPSSGTLAWLLVVPGVAAAFYRPAPGTYGRLHNPFLGLNDSGRPRAATRPPRLRVLTGLPKLRRRLSMSAAQTMMVSVVAIVAGVSVSQWLVRGAANFSPTAFIFNGAPDGGPLLLLLPLLMLMIRDDAALSVGRETAPLAEMAKHLRVLPASALQFIRVLISRRAVAWVAFYSAMLVVHVVLAGVPGSLRLEWLVLVIGLDALVDAGRLRTGRSAEEGAFIAFFVIGGALALVLRWSETSPLLATGMAVLLGLLALTASLPIYRTAISGRGSLYRA